jgi:hypothetical protein
MHLLHIRIGNLREFNIDFGCSVEVVGERPVSPVASDQADHHLQRHTEGKVRFQYGG